MARFTPVQIEVAGVTYNGSWALLDPGVIEVSSAYGSRKVRPGRADPDKAARAALDDIVLSWLKSKS